MPPSLADKLKSLGVKVGTAETPPPAPKPKSGVPIEAVVDGRWTTARRGEAFIYEQVFPPSYRHGLAPLLPRSPAPLLPRAPAPLLPRSPAPLLLISEWADDARLAELPLESFAFLDTETSGLAGGTGTYAFLVGVGRYEGDNFHLVQFFMRDPSEEPALLEALADFLAPCEALVTFNGKAFDAPLLAARYTLHAIPYPLSSFPHLDLLPLARRLWRDRLPSRALKYLEENVLNASRTVEEVPGYEIPYLYFDYLRTADATPLKGVFYHNAMDVVAMAALLSHMAHMLADPLGEAIEHGLDRIALAKLFEALGRWDTAAQLYERGLEQSLPEADFWQAVRRLSMLQRRRGDLASAVGLWEKAAADGHIYACVEMAKHAEHRLRDYPTALEWTRKAVTRVNELELPRYEHKHWVEELGHRRGRLEKKVNSEQ
jgi:uncharacterized protein YprB with RNaseH-like and TPR domain